MSSSHAENAVALAVTVSVTEDMLTVDLADGRRIAAPVTWYPRLANGSETERANWRLIGRGTGIHWPDLDEDISVEGLLEGQRSGESKESIARWLESRTG